MSSDPKPLYTNRLIHERSPYLLQHAHNPVDWYPWGEEAFEAAKREEKPVFLSIGYATCHWCQVMEKESFENVAIARLMNDTFINIKVDREEHPEIDSVYMEISQILMTTPGGWPLNVILTSDLKPFFAVTYLPPNSQGGLIGFDEFLRIIQQLWQGEEKQYLIQQADRLVELFQNAAKYTGEEIPNEENLEMAIELLFEMVDPIFGGIKGALKFPLAYHIDFLLNLSRLKKDSRALFYSELTLDMMAKGGIYDQLGGGFSRYSTDEKWHIPHFEKMLYDNALLAKVYLHAWQYTQKEKYRQICTEIITYLLERLADPQGGFYAAEGADSEEQEGRFYTWTKEEIEKVLPPEESAFICSYFNVTKEGNFEGRNVFYITSPLQEFPVAFDQVRQKLLKQRNLRQPPTKDKKVLTSWNGLTIDAGIRIASAFKLLDLRAQILTTADFIWETLWTGDLLLHRYCDGDARFSGSLDDYAFLIQGYLSLFEEGEGTLWLERALILTEILENQFKAKEGAFFLTGEKEPILLRKCEFYDSAEPSGNAVHCENLLRLHQMTEGDKYLQAAEDILKATKESMEAYPPGCTYHLLSLARYLNKKRATLLIALDEKKTYEKEIKSFLSSLFLPHLVTIWKQKGDSLFDQLLPNFSDREPFDQTTTFFLFQEGRCIEALNEWPKIRQTIEQLY
jgi:uncharacterized protein